MIELSPVSAEYTQFLSTHFNMSADESSRLIAKSDSELFENRFFKMYMVLNNGSCIGFVSLYEHSSSVVSIGPEIFEGYRNHGYGTEALKKAIDIAKLKGYRIICQQIRTNNTASIKLHAKLGFETDNYDYKNKNGNIINIYLKAL